MTDDDGIAVKAGDRISFSYGIPPVHVVGEVARVNGKLYVLTPGHNPKRCLLARLRGYVGGFRKVDEKDDQ